MTQRLATLYALREEHVRHLIDIALKVYQLTSQPHPLIRELCMPGNKLYQVTSGHLSYWHKKGFTERKVKEVSSSSIQQTPQNY